MSPIAWTARRVGTSTKLRMGRGVRSTLISVMALGAAIAVSVPAMAAPATSAAASVRSAAVSAGPFEVLAKFPSAPDANGASAIQIRFSGLLAPTGVRPTISPRIAGRWIVQRNVLIFRPDGAFPPGSIVTVTVPAGVGGVRSIAGRELSHGLQWRYGTSSGSLLRAQQILSELGYLPIHFVPAARALPTVAESEREVFVPAPGRFVWSWDAPAALRGLWDPGQQTAMFNGALMSFESQHALPVTGVPDSQVWTALLSASRRPALWLDRAGYTYALVDKANPETLTVWHDDKVVLVSPANTGGAGTPTADGSFPVYERLATQVMTGTNPDGTPYADPVSWVAYFNGGDAVHYIDRAYYGIPQSLGCVELPYAQAATAWPYLSIGSVVTVEG